MRVLSFLRQQAAAENGSRKHIFAIVTYIALTFILIVTGAYSKAKPGAIAWGPDVDLTAIAIAIGDIKHEMHGGLGRKEVLDELFRSIGHADPAVATNPNRVTQAIQSAAAIPRDSLQHAPLDSGRYVTTIYEDIGYADFYDIAFRIFGFHSFSTYYLFLSILVMSLIFYAAAYWRSGNALALLLLAVVSLFLTSTTDSFSIFTPNFQTNRSLTTLGVVPLLHILVAVIEPRPLTRLQKTAIILQALLLAFSIQLRTAGHWFLISYIFAVSALIVWRYWTAKPTQRSYQATLIAMHGIVRVFVITAIVSASVLGYGLLRSATLHEVYFSDDVIPHHMRWHSAVLGLSLHPLWQSKVPYPELLGQSGDGIGWGWFEAYMKRIYPNTPLRSLVTSFYPIRKHERIMQSEFTRFAIRNPRFMIELLLIYKPIEAARVVSSLVGTVPIIPWLLSIPAVFLAAATLRRRPYDPTFRDLTILVLAVWAGAIAPFIWAYPIAYVALDNVWTTQFLILYLGSVLLSLMIEHVRAIFRPIGSNDERHSSD